MIPGNYKSVGVALMIAVLTAMGCSSRNKPIGSEPDVVSEYPKIVMNSKSLAKAIALNPPTTAETPSGLLEVSQPIRNTTDDVLYIEYRFEWLDAQGRPVEPRMIWRYLRLEPNLPDYIVTTASSDEAEDYRLELRWSRQ